jgi:hypothetical protein
MADRETGTPPSLATWAALDPARYPCDPAEVPELISSVPPAVEQSDLRVWTGAVSVVLSARFGPWAYYWTWAPEPRDSWDWFNRFPPSAEAPVLAAELLLSWRRWLEGIAERFDRLRPLVDPAAAGPDDLAVTWESAIAELMRTAAAPVADDDRWAGSCRRVLEWFLTATGLPPGPASALVDDAVDRRFDYWVPLTEVIVLDVAERLTRGVLDRAGIAPAGIPDNWPDTWPQGWPGWRSTNTTGHD